MGFRGLVVSLSESSSDRTNSSEPAAFAFSFFFVDPLLRGGSSLTFGGGDGGGEGEDEDNSSVNQRQACPRKRLFEGQVVDMGLVAL